MQNYFQSNKLFNKDWSLLKLFGFGLNKMEKSVTLLMKYGDIHHFDYYKFSPKISNFQRIINIRKLKTRRDILLFIRIFQEVSKKLKRRNQFIVATHIKKLFKEAKSQKLFKYISEYSDLNENGQSFVLHSRRLTEEEVAAAEQIQFEKRIVFLKEIGLNFYQLNYEYDGFYFDALAEYFENASPEAIVQMYKRLKNCK